jgi:hypothetical protein
MRYNRNIFAFPDSSVEAGHVPDFGRPKCGPPKAEELAQATHEHLLMEGLAHCIMRRVKKF